jgi:hypothetical protein
MAEKTFEKAMGYGWRLFGIAFLLMLTYFIVWGYTFARHYITLAYPQAENILLGLPDAVYLATYVMFWVGVLLVPIAVAVVLLSALFEIHMNYIRYRALMAELKKTSS